MTGGRADRDRSESPANQGATQMSTKEASTTQTANNLAEVLQFGKPLKTGKALSVPTGPFGGACLPAEPPSAEFLPLVEMAADFGFPILTTAR